MIIVNKTQIGRGVLINIYNDNLQTVPIEFVPNTHTANPLSDIFKVNRQSPVLRWCVFTTNSGFLALTLAIANLRLFTCTPFPNQKIKC